MCIELHKKFDVAEVTTEVADKLRKHEIVIRGITAKAVFEIGGELKAAHDELSNYHGGVFVAWCDSIGYNPMQAKRYMDYHNFVLTNCENRELIESLPKSLVYEAGKKSAPAELTQKVLDGENFGFVIELYVGEAKLTSSIFEQDCVICLTMEYHNLLFRHLFKDEEYLQAIKF